MFYKVGVQIMDLTICTFQIKISHLAMKQSGCQLNLEGRTTVAQSPG